MPSTYNFDRVIDRKHTGSFKWRKRSQRDIIPMGVADMDFQSPPEVLEATQRRVAHGIFGYTFPTEELTETIQTMLRTFYHWSVDERWLVWLPGVVPGLNVVCRAAGETGDEVLTATPVYPPFLSAPENMGRKLVTVPLQQNGSRWTLDLDRLEAAITPRTRLFLLCNPHNPVGRVYSQQELESLAELCLEHDLWICSDEIHCGLVLDQDKRHLPLATIRPEFAERTITFMSPSKTFNLAGIGCAFAVIPNQDLRCAFVKAMKGIVPHVNALGFTTCLAAYQAGEPWRQALLDYLRRNRDAVMQGINPITGLSVSHIEATYLAWIDTRATGIEKPGHFFEDAGVDLWDGADFGGPGFVRLNFGCPHSQLLEGLDRIRQAMDA